MRGMAISPDGQYLVAVGFGHVRAWHPAVSGTPHDIGPKRMWEVPVFTSDPHRLYVADGRYIWKLRADTWDVNDVAPLSEWIVRLKAADDGRLLVLGGRAVSAVDYAKRRELWRSPGAGPGFDLSPDRRTVISMSHGAWVAIDLATGEEHRWPADPPIAPPPGPTSRNVAWSLSVSPNGDVAASCESGHLALTRIP